MDRETLLALAKAYTAAHERVAALGLMNRQTDPEKRVAQDAQYMLARDLEKRAYDDYYRALAKLSTEELTVLSE